MLLDFHGLKGLLWSLNLLPYLIYVLRRCVLKDEGYIRDFEHLEVEVGKPELKIQLKYYDGKPVIKNIERVSCPGRRVYSGIKELPNVSSGLGIVILSTPQGVISDSRARELKVGGEVLCNVV